MTELKQPRRALALGQTAIAITDAEELLQLTENFAVSINALVVTGDPDFDQWQELKPKFGVVERGAAFQIGDYIRFGEAKFGELAAQVLDASCGWSLKTIGTYKWVAESIHESVRRMDRLGIKHHMVVAGLTQDKQIEWLTKAANDDEEKPWSVSHLKKALAAGGDIPESEWYVVVGPFPNGQAQSDFMDRVEAEGLSAKASTRRLKQLQEAPFEAPPAVAVAPAA